MRGAATVQEPTKRVKKHTPLAAPDAGEDQFPKLPSMPTMGKQLKKFASALSGQTKPVVADDAHDAPMESCVEEPDDQVTDQPAQKGNDKDILHALKILKKEEVTA